MTMPTFLAGQRLTAADLQTLADQIDSLTAPGWVPYGSTFAELITASTTNPTQGSSTVYARYRKAADSDLCSFYIKVNIDTGGGFSGGSGTWRFKLPFAAEATDPLSFHATINESGVALRSGATNKVDTTHFEAWTDAAGMIASSGLSTSWSTGDWMTFEGTYSVA